MRDEEQLSDESLPDGERKNHLSPEEPIGTQSASHLRHSLLHWSRCIGCKQCFKIPGKEGTRSHEKRQKAKTECNDIACQPIEIDGHVRLVDTSVERPHKLQEFMSWTGTRT